MNERIKELAKQAGVPSLWIVGTDQQGNQILEKFAELIIRECIGQRKEVKLVGLHPEDYEQGVWKGLQMYENAIKRHFGVEE